MKDTRTISAAKGVVWPASSPALPRHPLRETAIPAHCGWGAAHALTESMWLPRVTCSRQCDVNSCEAAGTQLRPCAGLPQYFYHHRENQPGLTFQRMRGTRRRAELLLSSQPRPACASQQPWNPPGTSVRPAKPPRKASNKCVFTLANEVL